VQLVLPELEQGSDSTGRHMRIALSVGGTFHAPHLAYQLQKRGMLSSVYTSIPRSRFLRRAPIDSTRFHWCPSAELCGPRMAQLLHLRGPWRQKCDYWYAVQFDRTVRRLVQKNEPDLFLVFNRFGLETLGALQGITKVVERASTHSAHVEALLDEEYDLLGLDRSADRPPREILNRDIEEYERADYIVVPSAFARNSFAREGSNARKVVTIPLGVDTEMFRPGVGQKPATFRVMSSGGLGVMKGTHYLLTALEKLAIPGVQLVLAGPVEAYLRGRIAKSKVNCEITGPLAQRELVAHYGSASVFCLPSVQDGFGMVVLEAMACGTPVIVSTNTGASDVVREGFDGYSVPVRDADTLAERILRLYRNPDLREQMGRNSRQRALEYTWDAYGERVARCYGEMLRKGQGAVAASAS
jgi:glycosyltransferase involved in cell wall biosynthesis